MLELMVEDNEPHHHYLFDRKALEINLYRSIDLFTQQI